jgi:hypothetical protein
VRRVRGALKVERWRLVRGHRSDIAVEYVRHAPWFNGVPSYVELVELPESLEEAEVVELRTADGQRVSCLVLDGRSSCAVLATL